MAGVDVYVSEEYEKRARRSRFLILISVLAIIFVIAAVGIWLVFYSPLFLIQNINISGNERISQEEISEFLKSRILGGAFWRHILGFQNILVWPKKLTEDDLKFLPQLKSIEIERKFRERSINVRAEERKPFGIWCLIPNAQINADSETQTNVVTSSSDVGVNPRYDERQSAACWWFDEKGILYEKTLAVEGNIIPAVDDYSQDKLGLGSAVLPEDFMPNLISIFRVLRDSGISVKEVRLEDIGLEEIKVTTYDGPELYFSLRIPADNALTVISSLAGKAGLKNIKYIDFRVGNRAYYK